MKYDYKKFRLIFCSFFPVGLEDYVEYMRKTFPDFYYLKWKFPHSMDKKTSSELVKYKNGKALRVLHLPTISVPKYKVFYFLCLPLSYFAYLVQSLSFLFISKRKYTIFMGINYFCTFCGIMLKKLHKVDFVIYRVMDFFPLPPSGIYRILNKIFYKFDNFCLRNADSIWFTTEGHIIGREKYGYFDRKKFKYEIIPLGVKKDKIVFSDKFSPSIVYCGVVSRYHQLDLIFEAIKLIKKTYPDIRFDIIGSGPDLLYFKDLAKQSNLEKNIIFHGYMPENEEFVKIISESALGIALYKDEENFMKYTEPAKVKYYLNFGVPAVVSKVPQIAFELDRRQISFAVNNSGGEISEVVCRYFKDKELQKKFKSNIKEYLAEIDVDSMLEKRFEKTFSESNFGYAINTPVN